MNLSFIAIFPISTSSEFSNLQAYTSQRIESTGTPNRYWKELAMPTQLYLNHLKLEVETNNLSSLLELALNHLVFRLKKNKKQT
jgi:hypothetical protein